MTFTTRAWVAWWAATLLALSVLDAPAITATIAAACVYVASTFELPGGDGRAYRVMLRVGLVLLVVRVVLFGLAGHVGPTTVVTLPALRMPALLGGFTLGGRITGEVLAQEAAEGLRVLAVLVACGALLSVVSVARLLRLLPARMRSASLVLTIAIVFIPHLAQQVRTVREAQRMRGARARGVRALRGIVVPVLGGAIDRSFEIAASMEARGYGGARPTRRRPEVATAWDRALIAGAACVAVGALAVRGAPGVRWYAYPVLSLPAIDPRALLLATMVAAPVGLATLRTRHLARAADRQPTPALHEVAA